jgi:hypothetical protein
VAQNDDKTSTTPPPPAPDRSPFSKPAMEKLEKGLDPYGNRDAPPRTKAS